jgi:hypothetical protein
VSDTCPDCGKVTATRETRKVRQHKTGRCVVWAGWYVCLSCGCCWDGVVDGDGYLPYYVKGRDLDTGSEIVYAVANSTRGRARK